MAVIRKNPKFDLKLPICYRQSSGPPDLMMDDPPSGGGRVLSQSSWYRVQCRRREGNLKGKEITHFGLRVWSRSGRRRCRGWKHPTTVTYFFPRLFDFGTRILLSPWYFTKGSITRGSEKWKSHWSWLCGRTDKTAIVINWILQIISSFSRNLLLLLDIHLMFWLLVDSSWNKLPVF